MLKPHCPCDSASQHTLNILGDTELPLQGLLLPADTTGDVLLCLTLFSVTWKPQTTLEVLKRAQRQVTIAAQSLLVALCSCIQHFWSAQRFGCQWKSVSLCFSLHRVRMMPGFPSNKVTAIQTHFLKSIP